MAVSVASAIDAQVTPKSIAWEVKTPTAVAHSNAVRAALRKLQDGVGSEIGSTPKSPGLKPKSPGLKPKSPGLKARMPSGSAWAKPLHDMNALELPGAATTASHARSSAGSLASSVASGLPRIDTSVPTPRNVTRGGPPTGKHAVAAAAAVPSEPATTRTQDAADALLDSESNDGDDEGPGETASESVGEGDGEWEVPKVERRRQRRARRDGNKLPPPAPPAAPSREVVAAAAAEREAIEAETREAEEAIVAEFNAIIDAEAAAEDEAWKAMELQLEEELREEADAEVEEEAEAQAEADAEDGELAEGGGASSAGGSGSDGSSGDDDDEEVDDEEGQGDNEGSSNEEQEQEQEPVVQRIPRRSWADCMSDEEDDDGSTASWGLPSHWSGVASPAASGSGFGGRTPSSSGSVRSLHDKLSSPERRRKKSPL